MLCDLIIDGNYVLSKLVFSLHKNNLLYGALHKALENSINNYRKQYPYSNVYLVSDSREKSWRKDVINHYKGKRKKDTGIDWDFVYTAYAEVKDSMKNNKVLEYPRIEGDDWISFLVEEANKKGRSTVIVTNDYDIKQVLGYKLDPLYINIMSNEMYNKEKVFLPVNYQLFLNKLASLPNDDIFNLNDNFEFLSMIRNMIEKCEIHEVDPIHSLIIKLISGDTSDNIDSAWFTIKNDRKRGIGEKGAQVIYEDYLEAFGEVDLNDKDLHENIADVICTKKKLSKTNMEIIVENIKQNVKLIDLKVSNLPTDITDKMTEIYNNLK